MTPSNNDVENDPFIDDIPKQFRQRYDEALFDECNFCRRIFNSGQGYVINKIYQDSGCVYEIAYCINCQKSLQQTFSSKSINAVNRFFPSEEALRKKRLPIMLTGKNKCEQLTSYCIKCEAPKEDVLNYHEYAICEDDQLVYGFYPYMLCESCLVLLYNLLSSETIQAYNNFMDAHFGLPPDFYSRIGKRAILFV